MRSTHRIISTITLVTAVAGIAGCGSSSKPASAPPTTTTSGTRVEPVVDPGDGGHYQPDINPADFVAAVDNPYMPWKVGSTWRYRGVSDGKAETTDVTVTDQHKKVMGIDAVVVRDTVKVEGAVIEDTFDWYAQDKEGNVWYLGERVKDFENGELVSTAGSWEAGADGALPGIVMPADPRVGDAYRQEYYAGEAEDMAEVTAAGRRVRVPAGSYADVVVTRDWNPLEPAVVEEKSYAPGVGLIAERKTAGGQDTSELVEYTAGP